MPYDKYDRRRREMVTALNRLDVCRLCGSVSFPRGQTMKVRSQNKYQDFICCLIDHSTPSMYANFRLRNKCVCFISAILFAGFITVRLYFLFNTIRLRLLPQEGLFASDNSDNLPDVIAGIMNEIDCSQKYSDLRRNSIHTMLLRHEWNCDKANGDYTDDVDYAMVWMELCLRSLYFWLQSISFMILMMEISNINNCVLLCKKIKFFRYVV
ncbi:hypothetical protein DMN91_002093 [Ooceraea biroi]|uniref:Uncharacterized protein n=1 Tax=Ooceraea biroi TaxID=2015173 RepID=A0A3L8DZM5_OOCBI|nr:hypothetical protein DMN91_002093 [Ooceraea biroi]